MSKRPRFAPTEDNVIFDNKIHLPNPALADGDGPILAFRKWAAQFYATA
jgi:3-Ketosteroid 9alpha-hydroxylase C-terminal domain